MYSSSSQSSGGGSGRGTRDAGRGALVSTRQTRRTTRTHAPIRTASTPKTTTNAVTSATTFMGPSASTGMAAPQGGPVLRPTVTIRYDSRQGQRSGGTALGRDSVEEATGPAVSVDPCTSP